MEGLTEKQAKFVECFVSGGMCAEEAARAAGYANARTDGWRVQQVPAVRAAIQQERIALINGEGAKLAWRTMEGLMRDTCTPAAVRFQAARWTLEASGLGLAAKIAEKGIESEKALAELSLGELEAFISKGREALASLKAVHPAGVVEVEALPSGVDSGELSSD